MKKSSDLTLEEVRKIEAETDNVRFAFEGSLYLEQCKGDKVLLRDELPEEVVQSMLAQLVETLKEGLKDRLDKLEEKKGVVSG